MSEPLEVIAEEITVEVHEDGAVEVVEVGLQGPPGAPGTPGGSAFEHLQPTPAAVWVINHNLGYYPDVHVYSTGGVEIIADVLHVSPNQAQVGFAAPTAGRARCT